MSKKVKVWLDSGASTHSEYSVKISLDDIGISDEEWDEMSDDERDEVMRDIAFDRASWGYREIND